MLVLGAALLGGLGVRCRPDRLLDKGSSAHGEGNLHDGKGREADHAPPTKRTSASSASPVLPAPAPPPVGGSVHLAMGTPTGNDPSADTLLVKPQYALSYNQHRNVANWVSWNLDESYFGDAPRHKGKFLPDESLPQGFYRVRDQDYSGSGYDRGHMVRSEERTRTPEDNTATFLLTNVLPQRHDLNAGPWLRLEDYCQDLAQKEHKELYIMAGGVFHNPPETIGHDVAVPESCFKIVVVLDRGQGVRDVTDETRVIAVLMPNITGILNEPWGEYRTSVREIERLTGYRFLTAVPNVYAGALKSRIDSGSTSLRH